MYGLHCSPLLWFYLLLSSVSTSDEYVAMGSFSVSDTVSSVGKGQSAANNVDTSHQPSTEAVSATTAASRQEKGTISL